MVTDIDSLLSLYDFALLEYRSASDFCVLTLYPATLLNLLISSSNLLIVSFEFSMYCIMSSAPVRVLLLLFLSGFLLFLFFFSNCCN